MNIIPNYGNQLPSQSAGMNPYPAGMPIPQPNTVPLAQMPVPQVQKTYLMGKYIQDESDILPAEIPMDGNRSYFPSADENYILVKYWDSNGKIQTRKYTADTVPQEIKPDIYETLGSMNSKIDELRNLLSRNNQKPPFKKEGGQNA